MYKSHYISIYNTEGYVCLSKSKHVPVFTRLAFRFYVFNYFLKIHNLQYIVHTQEKKSRIFVILRYCQRYSLHSLLSVEYPRKITDLSVVTNKLPVYQDFIQP
jgi:hypothetical protein